MGKIKKGALLGVILCFCVLLGYTDTNIQAEMVDNDEVEVYANNNLSEWMPDPILQNLVATRLGMDKSLITKDSMQNLTVLFISSNDTGIADLTGLEYATNLKIFSITASNAIVDFSILEGLHKLDSVTLMTKNITDANLPTLSLSVRSLDLKNSSVTDASLPRIAMLSNLETLSFETNMNITTIKPLVVLKKLVTLRVQFCGISDFTPINDFESLNNLSAHGQNTGRNDPITELSSTSLDYNTTKQELFIPFSIMPNRLTNFDGYIPPFMETNSQAQTNFEINDIQLPAERLEVNATGIKVLGMTQEEFNAIEYFTYNARLNNPQDSYEKKPGYQFYSITSGTYFHTFHVTHKVKGMDVKVSYIDEQGNTIAPSEVLSGFVGDTYASVQKIISGYTFKEMKTASATTNGVFTNAIQEVVYVYKKNSNAPKPNEKPKSDEWIITTSRDLTNKMVNTAGKDESIFYTTCIIASLCIVLSSCYAIYDKKSKA